MRNNIKAKLKNKKKGAISLLGIVVTLIVVFFLQGYLDTTSASYILEESQSIIDLTALTSIESSVDLDGLKYERMTLRRYDYDYEANHITNVDKITPSMQAEIEKSSIWLNGSNAYKIENYQQSYVNEILKTNFKYYMDEFLGQQLKADGVNIVSYEISNFTGKLFYDNWGVNRKYYYTTTTYEGSNNSPITHNTNEYMSIPQASIDAIIKLEVNVDPTFTTAFYNYKLYNAQSTISDGTVSGTYLVDSGFNAKGNLVLTIRTLCRTTMY